jgi:hypothetical protein
LQVAEEVNKSLLQNLNATGQLHMVPATLNRQSVIRFCVCAERANEKDVDAAWQCITDMATKLLGK